MLISCHAARRLRVCAAFISLADQTPRPAQRFLLGQAGSSPPGRVPPQLQAIAYLIKNQATTMMASRTTPAVNLMP